MSQKIKKEIHEVRFILKTYFYENPEKAKKIQNTHKKLRNNL